MTILPGTTRTTRTAVPFANLFKKGAGLLFRGSTSGEIGLLSPAAPTSYNLTLPTAVAAVTGYVLQSTDAGVLSWVAQTVATVPAGSGTEIQYRNAGAFGAVAGSSWDGTTLTLSKAAPVYLVLTNGSFPLQAGSDGAVGAHYGLRGVNGIAFAAAGDLIPITISAAGVTNFVDDSSALGRSTIRWGGLFVKGLIVSGGMIYAGNAVTSATPTDGYLKSTGGSGTNIVGGNLIIAPGPSTGNATPSSVIIQSSVATTSGSTAQTLANTLTVTNGMVGIRTTGAPTRYLDITGSAGADRLSYDGTALYVNGNTATYTQFVVSGTSGSNFCVTCRADGVDLQNTTNSQMRWGANSRAGDVVLSSTGRLGISTTAPDKQVEINAADGGCLRLTYNDSNGSATNYTDFDVTSAGGLTITPSAGIVLLPTTTQLQFRDTGLYLYSATDGYLDIVADTAIRLRNAAADTDVLVEFFGTTNTGQIKWWEDEDEFEALDRLKTSGGRKTAITTLTDTGNVLVSYETVICSKATDFTITLPAAAVGQTFHIKNINTGIVTIEGGRC